MIRKRIAVLGVALAALVLGLVGVAAPAAAAESDCSPGQMCLWTSSNATGTRFQASPTLGNCINLSPASVDNNSDWGYNRTGHNIWTQTGYNGAGTSTLWYNGDHGAVNLTEWNNISSICRWY
jgi:hypothetical protein